MEHEKEGLLPIGQHMVGLPTETRALIEASVSPNTLRAYRQALARLDAWRGDTPITDSVMARYITGLHEGGLSPSSIAIAVAAVQWVGRLQGAKVLGLLTEKTMHGIREEGRGRGRGQVDGLTWEEVESVCVRAERGHTLTGLRDSALIRVMSDGLLRVSEAVAIDCEHIEGGVLFIPKSKTDVDGKGEHLYLGQATLEAIETYRTVAWLQEGALFRRVLKNQRIGPGRLTSESARRIIQARAKAAGVDGFISGHSLRVGAAVSLARAGASVVEMQVAGRWEDVRMPAHYASAELVSRGAVAKYKYGKGDNNGSD